MKIDIFSMLIGKKMTGGSGGSGDSGDDVDKFLDRINGEIVGEELYHITFMNGTEELTTVDVYEGYDCADPVKSGLIETPTKASTKYISYTFAGWSLTDGGSVNKSALLAVKGNKTVYAVYKEETIYLAKGSWTYPTNSAYYMNWNINPDYILTITGNLESIYVPNYSPYLTGGDVPPWYGFRNEILSVVVNVGQIGAGWFYEFTKLTGVSLANKITSIGLHAFEKCTSLTSIVIPSECRQIGNNCFDSSGLVSITIPTKVKYIYEYAFKNVTTLTNVIFERLDGWYYGTMSNPHTNGGTLIDEDQVADSAFMANFLVENARNNFVNSEAA